MEAPVADALLSPLERMLDRALPETVPARQLTCAHIWAPRKSSVRLDFHSRPLYGVECVNPECKRKRRLNQRELAQAFFAGQTSGFDRVTDRVEYRRLQRESADVE